MRISSRSQSSPPVTSSFDASHPMRQIRSRTIAAAAIALSLAFVAHAGATATYDYDPGQFLVIEGRASPNKKITIVTGENKVGVIGSYLRDEHTKQLISQLEAVATGLY